MTTTRLAANPAQTKLAAMTALRTTRSMELILPSVSFARDDLHSPVTLIRYAAPFVRYLRARGFTVTWLTYAGFYLCRKNFSVVIPLLLAQGVASKTEVAKALAAYSMAYAL